MESKKPETEDEGSFSSLGGSWSRREAEERKGYGGCREGRRPSASVCSGERRSGKEVRRGGRERSVNTRWIPGSLPRQRWWSHTEKQLLWTLFKVQNQDKVKTILSYKSIVVSSVYWWYMFPQIILKIYFHHYFSLSNFIQLGNISHFWFWGRVW